VAVIVLSRRYRLALTWGLVLGLATWMTALGVAPYVLAGRSWPMPAVEASLGVYVIGGVVCHQNPARSFHLWGLPMPVCARCTGLYAGALLGAAGGVLVACRRRWRPLGHHASESLWAWRVGLVVAAAPTAATLALEKIVGLGTTNSVRAAAGVILGAGVGWIVASSLRGRGQHGDLGPEVNCPDASDNTRTEPAG
jgi:uncharacterized membrane protein